MTSRRLGSCTPDTGEASGTRRPCVVVAEERPERLTVRRTRILGRLGIAVVVALGMSSCAGGDDSSDPAGQAEPTAPDEASAPASGNPEGGAELSAYCTGECAEALELEAAAESIDCQVAVSWNGLDHSYGAATADRTEAAATAFPNMDVSILDGRSDATTQSQQVEDVISRGVDVLIISPADADALEPAVARARDEGIEVITADRTVEGDVLTHIGSDNVEAGQAAGEFIAEELQGGGAVVELQGSAGASPTIDRHDGIAQALETVEDIEVVADPIANYSRAEALAAMEDLLQRFGPGEVDAVVAHDDEMALGALQAIEEAGRSDEILVVGIDGTQEALERIKAGEMAATVVYPVTAPDHVYAAAKACAGEELPERIIMDSLLVTEENVSDVEGTTF